MLLILFLHFISYDVIKTRTLKFRKWGLNICCGKTDGGGVNADIIKHAEIPNFIKVDNIYSLPFADEEFDHILCSHTMEHVEDPKAFFNELQRIGRSVTILNPPLWDLWATFWFVEHKWFFLSLRSKHVDRLPQYRHVPFSRFYHNHIGQKKRG
jgi:hypothetical protein